MNFSPKQVALFLLFFILSVFNVGCVNSDSAIMNTKVALTVNAIAKETIDAGKQQALITTHVAETLTVMDSQSDTIETAISTKVIQTSIAGPLIAEPATISPSTSLPEIRAKEVMSPINVRIGPNTCFKVFAHLSYENKVSLLGQDITNSWYQIKTADNVIGWVWKDFTELIDSSIPTQIPIANTIPSCPTPTSPTSSVILTPTQENCENSPCGNPPTKPPTPTRFPPTPGTCGYPPCGTPTIGATPTYASCSYPPCSYP